MVQHFEVLSRKAEDHPVNLGVEVHRMG